MSSLFLNVQELVRLFDWTCVSMRNSVSRLKSMGLSRRFPGGTAASELQGPK